LDRARLAARRHRETHGELPTATELAQLAGTSRGTAGNALKDLRTLHLVNANPDDRTTQ
jgi:DNA-binding GntR family transcriptional regulator